MKVQGTLQRWEQLPGSGAEREVLHKELLSACESIEWQVRRGSEFESPTGCICCCGCGSVGKC